jgi:outer membrane protein TolC
VSLKEVIGVQERLLANNLEHERDAKVRVEAGAMPKITLIRAQIDRSKAEQDLQRARMAYAAAKITLGTLLDREADFEVTHPTEPQVGTDQAGLEEAAQRDRPDIAAARLGRDLADKTHSSVYYQYLPAVFGTATFQAANVQGFSNAYGSWALGVALSWTLWDGGLREVALKENEYKLRESEEALRSAQIKARDEVRRTLLDLESARSNRIKAEETVKLARENMQLVTVNYQAGAATQIEVSDANTALVSAELGAVSEALNAQLAALRLLKAAGAFNPK